jgi:acyl carrier protein
MELEDRIKALMRECAAMSGSTLTTDITDDLVLLDSGLDSLGFATLVVRLEEELGFDPFTMRDDIVYPTTFGEFVAIYRDASMSQPVRGKAS